MASRKPACRGHNGKPGDTVPVDAPIDPDATLEVRVRELERENARLRLIVADNALEIETLRELSRGTY